MEGVEESFKERRRRRNKSWKEWLKKGKDDGLVSLLKGIATFVGYLTPKPSLKKNNSDTT